MVVPIPLNFDFESDLLGDTASVHLPKIKQGASYLQDITVKIGGVPRDFTGFTEIRMQIREALHSPVLLSLNNTNGTLLGLVNGLRIQFGAALTNSLTFSSKGDDIPEISFVHDIELVSSGGSVECFAQGTGYIIANVTR